MTVWVGFSTLFGNTTNPLCNFAELPENLNNFSAAKPITACCLCYYTNPMYLDYAVILDRLPPSLQRFSAPRPLFSDGWKYVGTSELLLFSLSFTFPHHHQQLQLMPTQTLMLEIVEGCSGACRKT